MKTTSSFDFTPSRVIVDLSVYPKISTTYYQRMGYSTGSLNQHVNQHVELSALNFGYTQFVNSTVSLTAAFLPVCEQNTRHAPISVAWTPTTDRKEERLRRTAIIEQDSPSDSVKAHHVEATSIFVQALLSLRKSSVFDLGTPFMIR